MTWKKPIFKLFPYILYIIIARINYVLTVFITSQFTGNIQKYDSNISLTFCICPYPVDTEDRRDRYFITFTSWLSTSPSSKILILMPSFIFDPNNLLLPSLKDIFGSDRILFGPVLETDEDGIPFIDDWFIQGLDHSSTELICWINADIITPKGWFPRIQFLYKYFHSRNQQFGVISRRCDFNVTKEDTSFFFSHYSSGFSNFGKNHTQKLFYDKNENVFPNKSDFSEWPPNYDYFARFRAIHSIWGIDFFLLSRNSVSLNFDEIPPFHMGRYRWDPWITGWLNNNVQLTTLGNDFCTYHINHVPTIRNSKRPKVKENLEMAARNGKFLASNGEANFHFEERAFYRGNIKICDIPNYIPKENAPLIES
ncbi:hypothetical protein TRFO_42080 [Tritrichomonas foetus]|uniref:Uncharacterized protein n=1 Tax=Tritrichomonas foetus TaxID=1144522 RepID=A0A1J4L2F5_9EUKA|nr:hypothetical protein TRFO_42080 [Tritrichomonas foetus]|eukprot:OHT16077.1 hypothetical protein TRFO_42080 [Tritrichomonas foetus]